MKTINPGSYGVFLSDENTPPTIWEYQGENATDEHVFTTGKLSTDNFRLTHRASLEDFWKLASF